MSTWGISISSISKHFENANNVPALSDVSFEVKPGELVTLLGPSGCGKTTLLRIIAGLEEPTKGSISVFSADANEKCTFVHHDQRVFLEPYRRNVGMVFQSYALWPHRTVFQNISFPLEIQKKSKGDCIAAVKEILGRVSLTGFEHRYPHELSGGQQQRVALARALVQKPRILLLDEPLSNLDVALRASVRREIKDLNRELRLTMVYVTHDRTEALELSDKMCIFDHGKLVQQGTPEEITKKPSTDFVRQLVLG